MHIRMYSIRPRKDMLLLGALLGLILPADALAGAVLGVIPGVTLVFWSLLFWGAAVLFVVGRGFERARSRIA